jgi:hypothetical protein
MKTGRQPWIMIALAVVALSVHGQSFSLYSASNSPSANIFSVDAGAVQPSIEMKDVPLSAGITRLAKQAGVNVTLDERVSDWWGVEDSEGHRFHEPILNFTWTNLTARQALFRLLQENHLSLDVNPITKVAYVVFMKDEFNASVVPEGPGRGTNSIPLVQFEGVPFTIALENLGRQGLFNYILDPYLRYGEMDDNGNIQEEPIVNIRRTHTTAEDVFLDVCAQCHLRVVWDTNAGVIFVRMGNHEVNRVDPDIYKDDTNKMPLIEFHNDRVSEILTTLAKGASMKCMLSPRINAERLEQRITFRWEDITAGQAFAAVCEDCDLEVSKYPIGGVIKVEPAD